MYGSDVRVKCMREYLHAGKGNAATTRDKEDASVLTYIMALCLDAPRVKRIQLMTF